MWKSDEINRRFDTIALLPVYARIASACLLVFCVGRWGMLREMESIRQSVGRTQTYQAKSHAERTVERLERDTANGNGVDLASASNASWLREHWHRTRDQEPMRTFRAVVDAKGTIVAHSDSRKVGQLVRPHGNNIRVPEFGDDFVEIQDSVLTDDLRVIDIPVEIRQSDRIVGTYHVGLSADWLNKKIAAEQNGAWWAWTLVIISAMAIVGVSGILLYRLARRATWLERELHEADSRRSRELSTLMVGMAHEVRNPLNSIRLNLYTSEKVFRGESQLADQEVLGMLAESVREIERVDSLIGQLLGYARVENDREDVVDVAHEINSAIQFVKPTFDSQAISIEFCHRAALATMIMDRRRIRQILLNLLNNARDAIGGGGRIRLILEVRGNLALLSVADTGTGVDPSIRSRMFEPFITTREGGTGLGLAVVKSMLESIGGTIDYKTSEELGGAEFILSFPIGGTVRK